MRPLLVIVSPWYPSRDDPALGSFVADQARALCDRLDVAVIAPVLVRWSRRLIERPREPSVEEADGLRVVRPRVHPARPFSRIARYRAYEDAVLAAWRALRDDRRPIAVHGHVVLPTGPGAVALARLLDCPVVLTEHSNPFSMHLLNATDRELAGRVLHAADRVIAVSPTLAGEISAFAPDVEVIVVGNVVDTSRFRPAEAPVEAVRGAPLRLLSVGLLTADKGMGRVLRATALVARERPVELVVVGDGRERRALERLLVDLGLGESARLVGIQDRTAVRDWMQWSDVLVLGSDRETFGVVLAEAMACGTPVAATPTDGARFVVEAVSGVVAASFEDEALATAIRRVAAGEHGPRDAIRANVEERFGVGAFREAMYRIYDSLEPGRPSTRSGGEVPRPAVDGESAPQLGALWTDRTREQ